MTTLDHVTRVLRDHAEDFRRLGAEHMAVFGSVARGEAGADSDVDLVVKVDETRPVSLIELIQMEQRAERLLGRKVDLCDYRGLKPALRRAFAQDGVKVF